MTTAFVLGNGLSRKSIDLANLKKYGRVYGCNALYREFTPDVLVATDQPIATQIQESGYALNNRFYTRRPTEGSGANKLPQPYFGYSSGPNAVALAAADNNSSIYLLGFDMGPNKNNLFNNIYADTEFYKSSSNSPTFAGNWVKQIIRVCKDYPSAMFIRVCGDTTASISELDKIFNLRYENLLDFVNKFSIQP
jgi:hypothetical protein